MGNDVHSLSHAELLSLASSLTAAACACGPSVPTDDEAKEKAMKQFHAIYRELCSEYGQARSLSASRISSRRRFCSSRRAIMKKR